MDEGGKSYYFKGNIRSDMSTLSSLIILFQCTSDFTSEFAMEKDEFQIPHIYLQELKEPLHFFFPQD